MKHKIFLSSFIAAFGLMFCSLILGQAPEIEWENTIRADSPDYIKGMAPTDDGGFIIAAESSSPVAKDKTLPSLGGTDYWIIKLKPSGGIKWQKVFGGNLNDDPYAVAETADGGYVIGGTSYSGISGNKTENTNGGTDFWVVKVSSTGTLLWQNTIGGVANDNLFDLTATLDGGVALIGQSSSGISGDKTEAVVGGTGDYDYWVVKLDVSGNIEWQNTIGGTSGDIGGSITQLPDGSYIIGGISWSGATGDKSESNIGGNDMWVLKISSTGNIIWQNTIGTADYEYQCEVKPTEDGGFILGSSAYQVASGDKTETGHSMDYWVLKLNAVGEISWQNTIIGFVDDYLSDIIPTSDGGYLVGGVSYSSAGFDKSEDRLNIDPDLADLWIVKLNNVGNIVWENTIGGDGDEFLYGSIAQADDGGYIIGASSGSSSSFDKSENSNNEDLWLIKIFADSCTPASEVCNGIDDDCNGLVDDGIVETCSIIADGLTSFCPGGSVNLTATYSGTDIQWFVNGFVIGGAAAASYAANSKGTYTAMTSSACGTALSNEIFVNVYKNPSAFISPDGPTIFCAGESVHMNVTPVGGCTYQWYKGATALAGEIGLSYTATTSGNYKCRVTKAATGCYKNSNAIAVSVPCREGDNITQSNFSLYPNPANNFITIETDFSTEKTIYITDAIGQIVKTITTSESNITIDLQGIASGVYFIKMEDGISLVTQKFVKQ